MDPTARAGMADRVAGRRQSEPWRDRVWNRCRQQVYSLIRPHSALWCTKDYSAPSSGLPQRQKPCRNITDVAMFGHSWRG